MMPLKKHVHVWEGRGGLVTSEYEKEDGYIVYDCIVGKCPYVKTEYWEVRKKVV